MEQESGNQSFQQRSLNKFQKKNQKKRDKKQKKYGKKGGQPQNLNQTNGGDEKKNMEGEEDMEVETLSFKEKQKQNLLKQLHQISILQGDPFNYALIKLFKEHNRDQMKRICERFEVNELVNFAEKAIHICYNAKPKREKNSYAVNFNLENLFSENGAQENNQPQENEENIAEEVMEQDNQVPQVNESVPQQNKTGEQNDEQEQVQRTLGGTYMKLIKDYLNKEDPMKLKDVFQRSEQQKKKKNQNTRQRREKLRQNQNNSINSGQKTQNIFEAFNN